MTTIGERIRALRLARGWTIAELADRFGGRKQTAVSLWENGKRLPTTVSLLRLAEIFGVEASVIDPNGDAYDPRVRRYRRALQKSRTSADSGEAPLLPGPEVLMMNPGGLFDVPDAELFQKVLGVWLNLDSHDDRAEFLEHARGFRGGVRHARAKNNRR